MNPYDNPKNMRRFSSRRQPIGKHFLQDRLKDAVQYDRIAGYFSSSILEIAGEQIDQMPGQIRMVCNSDLDPLDVQTARAAAMAVSKEWKSTIDKLYSEKLQNRLKRLHALLQSEKLSVRVLPDAAFGLVHGKAGVITFRDGRKTSFLGSANESKSAWQLHYELLWEDDSREAVNWVQEEFDALWNHKDAVPLAETVVKDIRRLSRRRVVTHEKWKEKNAEPEAVLVESPIYRKHFGLWAHQKYFVKKAYEEHLSGRGARYVLADQVGLGKTVQLAMAAMLMALQGEKPVLVIAPKTLIYQWQDELMKLLHLPSAVWDGKAWIDENEIRHESSSPEKGILKCPRRFGIISQGLIVRRNQVVEKLLEQHYECVIVDEAHRSRRKNLKKGAENEKAEPNNLMAFLIELSRCTKSMMMGTATPVQLYPIEAFDLLYVLGAGAGHVLGSDFSKWRSGDKTIAFRLVDGSANITQDVHLKWDWVRDPFPPAAENEQLFGTIRRDLKMGPTDFLLSPDNLSQIKPWNRKRIETDDDFFKNHNPYIRFIIRRTRKFLEDKLDENGEPYLQKVEVIPLGEDDKDAIILPGYLKDAYQTAEEFCRALGDLMKASGFIRTLLLRRMGSSLEAGRKTAEKMLGAGKFLIDENEEEDFSEKEDSSIEEYPEEQTGIAARLTDRERKILEKLIYELSRHQHTDPKLEKLKELLFSEGWAALGCIIFSQYFDTVWYFSEQISQIEGQPIGLYAGAEKSGLWQGGIFTKTSKEALKKQVQNGELKIIFGTDSASEGLNLQRLGTLINLDLPWNPTRLEQRKGRIQRIGQRLEKVMIYNMRYRGSVEDRVHQLCSERLQNIFSLFGQIPDILQDVWINTALGDIEKAQERITEVETRSPFEIRYDRIEPIDFESYSEVLNEREIKELMRKGW